MQGRSASPALIDGKLPVFVFPSTLFFYTDDQTSHKQVLTLYNPYEFTLKFKVLSTAPKKYAVGDSEGYIKSRCCVDIVLRHKEVSINNEGIKDKFRISISEYGQRNIIGKKDVLSILLPTKEKAFSSSMDEVFESFSSPPAINVSDVQSPVTSKSNPNALSSSSPSLVIILAAVLCVASLMLPTQGESSPLPNYLHLTTNQKLIAAYILGLVTMVIFKS